MVMVHPSWWAMSWWRSQARVRVFRSVVPPWLQGMMWWAWHHSGGRSQPGAVQPRSRSARARGWAAVAVRTARPRSSSWLGPAQDGRDERGVTGDLAGRRRRDRFAHARPGDQRTSLTAGGCPARGGLVDAGPELVHAHGDHHLRGQPAGDRQPASGQGPAGQLDQRVGAPAPRAATVRAVHRGRGRGGEWVQRRGQGGGGRGVQPPTQVMHPIGAAPHGQLTAGPGGAFWPGQVPGPGRVDPGRLDERQPTQPAQVQPPGLRQQPGLELTAILLPDPIGQPVQRGGDHLRPLGVDHPGGQRPPGPVVLDQRGRQPDLPGRGPRAHPVRAQPPRRRDGPGRTSGRPAPIHLGHRGELDRGQPGRLRVQLPHHVDQGRVVGSAYVDTCQGVQCTSQACERARHRRTDTKPLCPQRFPCPTHDMSDNGHERRRTNSTACVKRQRGSPPTAGSCARQRRSPAVHVRSRPRSPRST